ncbi:RiPP maturation radical SAM C-methyltransferase [Amycolatopsis tolypomycina]|uniref:RiPP maturation radical SAM C-methyltransferase n=1 Tax=Amycolatopsis tolypomycina TaxID=208445 RepID=UPI0033BCAFD6
MQYDQQVPRTCLVSMPWHSLARPSLALGVLRASCAREGLAVPVSYHGSLAFAEVMLQAGMTASDYAMLADIGFHHSLGEWIFAGALHGEDFGTEGMLDLARRNELPIRTALAARELAGPFVDQAADAVLATDPELVGFSATFSQTIASLAVAARIKARRPDVEILIGGYSCDGDMGEALHREYPVVDFVLRGEADRSFPQLLRAIAERRATGSVAPLNAVPKLCWRNTTTGATEISPATAPLVPPAAMTVPAYEDWFAARPPDVAARIEPELVVESSRGCWWGAKSHCTFCGLNGTAMTHRAKPAESFVDEVLKLVTQYGILDVTTIDNILPNSYYDTALPQLAAGGHDLRLHYEIKANVRADDVAALAAAGVWEVQPGIESLVDDVVKRMRKGVKSAHNVRMLRDGAAAGLVVTWNWLYGFPGEDPRDYAAVVAQLPALVHLQPPTGAARINLQRFSPNFDDPRLGFTERRPAEGARYIHAIDDDDRLARLVYSFDTPDQGLSEDEVAPLVAALATWTEGYPGSTLTARELGDVMVIRDRRAGWPALDHVLEDPAEIDAWRLLSAGRSPRALLRELAGLGHAWHPTDLSVWLRRLAAAGLVYTDGNLWISLPTGPAAVPSPAAERELLPLLTA